MQKFLKLYTVIFIMLISLTSPVYSQRNNQTMPRDLNSIGGPYLTEDIKTGTESSNPESFMQHGNAAYFSADMGDAYGLWKTDGTQKGTRLVKENLRGPITINYESPEFIKFNESIFFNGIEPIVNDSQLWKTDGSSEGTNQVFQLDHANPTNFGVINDFLYFNAGFPFTKLYKTDGTSTILVRDEPLPVNTKFGDTLYFIYCENIDLCELKRFGTISELNLSGISVQNNPLVVFNGFLYFAANDGEHGSELWRTDGEIEVGMFMDLNLVGDGSPRIIGIGNDLLYLNVANQDGNDDLWRTDGTIEGTINIQMGDYIFDKSLGSIEQPTGDQSAGIYLRCKLEDDRYYSICFSDGTLDGTVVLTELNFVRNTSHTSLQRVYQVFGNHLYFTKYDIDHGVELWRSDGTPEGTALWLDILPGPASSEPLSYGICGERLCFSVDDFVHGRELWSTDGSIENTQLVMDINKNPGSANPTGLIVDQSEINFVGNDDNGNGHLWRINNGGNKPETVINDQEIIIDSNNRGNPPFIYLNHHYFYISQDQNDINKYRLWSYDQLSGQKWIVQDNETGIINFEFIDYVKSKDKLFFTSYDDLSSDYHIWQSDGTEVGTKIILTIDENNQNQWNTYKLSLLGERLVIFNHNSSLDRFEIGVFNENGSEINFLISSTKRNYLIDTDGDYLYYYRDYAIYAVDSNGAETLNHTLPGYYFDYFRDCIFRIDQDFYVIEENNGYTFKTTKGVESGLVNLDFSANSFQEVYALVEFNGKLAVNIFGYNSASGSLLGVWELIITDGTMANTTDQIGYGLDVFGIQKLGEFLYFIGRNKESMELSLYQTDGTVSGTNSVKNFGISTCSDFGYTKNDTTALKDGIFYIPLDKTNETGEDIGCELWAYNLLNHKLYLPFIDVNP